jgi:hypothetical protein
VAIARLQIACDAINGWLEGVKLSLNAVESVVILFYRRFAPLPSFKVLINGFSIPCSQTLTYLGFFIDAQLN